MSSSKDKPNVTASDTPFKCAFSTLCIQKLNTKKQQRKNKKNSEKDAENTTITTLSSQLSESCPFHRYLYCKKHQGVLRKKEEFTSVFNQKLLGNRKEISVEEQETQDKTIFVTNIAHDFSFRNLAQIFEQFGPIASMVSSEGNNICHIVFDDKESVRKVLKLSQEVSNMKTVVENDHGSVGLKQYFDNYINEMIEKPEKTKKHINEWMKKYDQKVQEEEKLIEALRGKPDDDGWITVLPSKGKRHTTPIKGDQLLQMNEDGKKPRNITQKEKIARSIPMYEFQRVELKRQKYQMLRDRFEQDKQKIAKMKEQRKFQPY